MSCRLHVQLPEEKPCAATPARPLALTLSDDEEDGASLVKGRARRPRAMTDWDTLHIACLDSDASDAEPGLVREGARSSLMILNIMHLDLQSATSTALYQARF